MAGEKVMRKNGKKPHTVLDSGRLCAVHWFWFWWRASGPANMHTHVLLLSAGVVCKE